MSIWLAAWFSGLLNGREQLPMSSSTATINAVPDGDTASASVLDNLPAFTGIIWARQKQVYHAVNMASDVLDEAQALLASLRRQAHPKTYPGRGEETVPLPLAEVSAVLNQILDCIDLGTEQLAALNTDLRNHLEDEES
jgi:hypothetical protein